MLKMAYYSGSYLVINSLSQFRAKRGYNCTLLGFQWTLVVVAKMAEWITTKAGAVTRPVKRFDNQSWKCHL